MRWIIYDIFLFLAGIAMMPHFFFKMRKRGGYRAN